MTRVARTNGKRPDGMTLLPWSNGRSIVTNFTCIDTMCGSYIAQTTKAICKAAKIAERKKKQKYEFLGGNYVFTPSGIETFGP